MRWRHLNRRWRCRFRYQGLRHESAVARPLPGARMGFERFRLRPLLNGQRDDLRRPVVREAETQEAKVAIQGPRWLRLSRRAPRPQNKAHQLPQALERKQPLATACRLKEERTRAWEPPRGEALADASVPSGGR